MSKSKTAKSYWLTLVGYYIALGLIVAALYAIDSKHFAVAAIALFYLVLTKITEQLLYLNFPADTMKDFFRTFPVNAVLGISIVTLLAAAYFVVKEFNPLTTALLIAASAYGLEKIILYHTIKD